MNETKGLSEEDLRRLADKLSARMASQVDGDAKGDARGRGLPNDAWVYDFHKTCPKVELIHAMGRLYVYCEPHRCCMLLGYESAVRTPMEEVMALEFTKIEPEVLEERYRRALNVPYLAMLDPKGGK